MDRVSPHFSHLLRKIGQGIAPRAAKRADAGVHPAIAASDESNARHKEFGASARAGVRNAGQGIRALAGSAARDDKGLKTPEIAEIRRPAGDDLGVRKACHAQFVEQVPAKLLEAQHPIGIHGVTVVDRR